jgi:hypothetical protein
MTLTCGATSGIAVTGLTSVTYGNPNFGGNGNVTFIYASGTTVNLTQPADIADALASIPMIQSMIRLSGWPSTIA